jgi:rod shape determining protein RodA
VVGSLLVMVILTYICLKTLTDSMASKNMQGRLICIGVFSMLFSHCLMNIGMVLKVMPVIGIPLPFMSAGGTAVVCMYTAIGLVNSTRCHNVRKYRIFYDAEPDK